MYEKIILFIRELFNTEGFIPLHEPRFTGNEKRYLNDCIDSTFVSSVGEYVDKFESLVKEYTGSGYSVATVNGTAALHIALLLSGVEQGDEVITQPLTFVATCNAIVYCGAEPVFIDVDRDTLGLSPGKLEEFIERNTSIKDDGFCYNKISGKRIKACVPMHTLGHPVRIDKIKKICDSNNIELIEDSAESIGSRYKNRHTGTFGKFGIFSFNGNKTITCGGGGVIVTDFDELAGKSKHITTTAKMPHRWDYFHDEIGFNYRMPNINASLACAQMEKIDEFIINKRELADLYMKFFQNMNISFIIEPDGCYSNYWLNGIILNDKDERDKFLNETNNAGIMTRPLWQLMHRLPMFERCYTDSTENSQWLQDRVVNIPSSVRI